MAISEKKLKEIQKRLDKSNEHVIKLYKQSGDEALLEMLYLNSEDSQEVAEEFEIPLEVAERLVEKDKAIKETTVDSNDTESKFPFLNGISSILEAVKNADFMNGSEEDSAEASNEDSEEDIEDEESEDASDDCGDSDFSNFPEKVIETFCFIGEVIQDVSEKICDALDESVERIQEHDFDF